MSVRRSPPRIADKLDVPVSITHYNSDSAINLGMASNSSNDQYFNVTTRQKRNISEMLPTNKVHPYPN
ncbi:unnamed protein product [Pieris macdunnoughi]|uniref:Uncharacterized protein n=1 Tax=Pieris macdunnoughi TaxID=345717 RepID=A0A821TWU3_9NEOP|nr:unnamed protein product [Pieris macdunnoughi]